MQYILKSAEHSLVLSCQSLSFKAFKYGKIKDLNIRVIAHLQMFY